MSRWAQDEACGIRHEPNLCVGSLVTVAYRVLDIESEFKSETDGDNASSNENIPE